MWKITQSAFSLCWCEFAGSIPRTRALFLQIQSRQILDNGNGFHAHGDDALEQVYDVTWIIGPVIWVITDTAGLVRANLMATHDLFDGGPPINHVFVGQNF